MGTARNEADGDRVVTTSDGVRLATRLEGREGGPFLVLSSSLGTTMEMWAGQVEALAPTHRVLRYDARGHGASDAPPGPYTMARLGRDVVEILDAYDVERASFCGVSMGGMVGQWLGASEPARLERLVLANTAARMGPPSIWDERIARVEGSGMAAIADGVLARWFTPAFREAFPAVVATIRAQLLATPPAGYAGCCAAIRDMDLRASAARITTPTLIIAGDADEATPAGRSHEIARAMPRAPEVLVLAAAHLSNLEQPAAFDQALRQFLS